jgi:hypothetical protein
MLAWTGCLFWCAEVLRAIAGALEGFALRRLASATPHGPWWLGLKQSLDSAATNTVDIDPSQYTGPTIYHADTALPLPYPPIVDDTEAISGFVDLVNNQWVKPGDLVLNLGGGAFEGGPKWLAQQVPDVTVLTADPFRRSEAANVAVQAQVEAAGGADVVASISVLNVIPEVGNRVAHAVIAHRALKPGGLAYFKVWSDSWPARGSGVGAADIARRTYQTQRWAHAYVSELEAAFGQDRVFADENANVLVAIKGSSVVVH